VILQETIKQDFTDLELRSLEVGDKFFWCWLPANGHSGGMLMGVRDSSFEVGVVDMGLFYLSTSILHRATKRILTIIGIYGPADHGRSRAFLEEISAKVARTNSPLLMGGDFNLIRAACDKNNDHLNWRLMDLFNEHIATWALREIPRSGARFTWTNRQLNPVRSVLDRVFISPALEGFFPLCSLTAETSLGSDHTPLIFDSGEGLPERTNRFFFESGWFERQEFLPMLHTTWLNLSAKVGGRDIIDWWQFMSGGLRQHLRGWARNLGLASKREKENLMSQILRLDVQADSSGLDEDEWAQRYYLEDQLLQIVSAEEEYWRQRGRVKWALQGDANTAYFHAVANGRRRKCTISTLNLGNEITNDTKKIQAAIYDFYRDLLGSAGSRSCSLSPRTWPLHAQVSREDNNHLMVTFSESELDYIVREMKSDTAPGPDGFPILFFKRFWPNVKLGVLHILNDFMLGRIDISRLNFAILTLIPKVPGADLVSQFRPIALINVIFKIVSKAFAYRLDPIAHKTISLNQTAFIKGRNLLEGPLALIEIVHELRSKKLGGILLKLDFEKAYDRVNWEFLAEVLRCKGFEEAYIHRVLQLVSGGQTAISINGVIGPYFRNKRGVRQGDPLSPLLFNFIGEALSGILSAAGAAGHLQGVVPHLIPGGISHLQYADDTLILIQNSEENIANLKFLLMCFEDMSGLKINYHKSEVIVMGQPLEEQQRIANKLNCKRGSFPFMYLGLPISDRKLRLEQWLFLVRKLAGRIEPWLSKLLTSGGRLILSNACLDSIPIFAMGLFLLQDGIHAKFDSHRSKFFWEGAGNKRKYHMVNWPSVCRPKSVGGLGLLNSKKMNIALLSKWVWKLYQDEPSIWASIIKAKYRDADNLFEGSGHGGSQFWKSLHKIKHFFKLGAKHLIGDGRRTFFWTDWWCGDQPIKELFPDLFNICDNPNLLVAEALESGELNITF
jgi:hypothetical protein